MKDKGEVMCSYRSGNKFNTLLPQWVACTGSSITMWTLSYWPNYSSAN